MSTNVGDLVVKLGADTREFEQAMGRATGPNSALASIGTIARNAAITAGVAIGAFATKGVADFMALDQGMREVFTLLPGITEDAMDDMTAEVLAFSREFGKLPDEVVPALYQALSAGVPADNVFAFLETANALAVGGVAELEDSVAVLAGAVNAYGEDMLTFEDASDALFTAVSLGVTTIPELAGAIGRVTPISADLGISFDHVAAMLAELTTVFPSTAEATTGLRTMLGELGRAGSVAGDAFLEASGTTFPKFIEAGGTVEEALQLLADKGDATGQRMNDFFGSIEGGMAASVLSGDEGSEGLRVALEAMDTNAGATQAAFETMDEGIQASWNRLKAGFATLSAEVGEELAPMFQQGVDWVVDVGMPALRDGVMNAFQRIQEFTATLTAVWERYQNDTDGYFANVRRFVETSAAAIGAAFGLIKTLWETVLKPAWDAIAPTAEVVFNAAADIIAVALDVVTGVLNALSALLRGDFIGAWDEMAGAVMSITDTLREWLQAAWNGIKDWLGTLFGNIAINAGIHWAGVVDAIKGAFDGFVGWVQGIFDSVLASIAGVLDGIVGRITAAWDRVSSLLGRAESAEQAAARSAAAVTQAEADMAAAQAADAARRAADGSTGTPSGSTPSLGADFRLPHEGGGMALGGIVTGPMRALIGEAGPEAVIPLARLDRMIASVTGTGGGRTIDFSLYLDGRQVARQVAPNIVNEIRMHTGIAGI